MKHPLSYLSVIVLFISLVAGSVYLRTRPGSTASQTSVEIFPSVAPTPVAFPPPTLIGWFAFWDEKLAYVRLQEVIQELSVFAPALYRVEEDGQLGRYTVLNRGQLLNLAQKQELPVTPTVGDEGDRERITLLLTQPDVSKRFITELVDEATANGFSGWNLDIEAVESNDRAALTAFLVQATERLHEQDLTLSIVVYARTEAETYDPALAYDFPTLGRTVDQIQIMAYNFNNDQTPPGSQTPLAWYREVLRYAGLTVPREKIVIGLSTHGYEWEGDRVRGLTYAQVERRIASAAATVEYSPSALAKVATFENFPSRVVYFEDAQTIVNKILLAREYGFNTFALWRIGAEDPAIWNALRQL